MPLFDLEVTMQNNEIFHSGLSPNDLKAAIFFLRRRMFHFFGQCNLHCVESIRIRSFSGPVLSPNTGKLGPEKHRIRTPSTQCRL